MLAMKYPRSVLILSLSQLQIQLIIFYFESSLQMCIGRWAIAMANAMLDALDCL